MSFTKEIAEVAARTAIQTAAPTLMDAGAKAFCEQIPLKWLTELLMGWHDDHGEFDYAKCAKDIKARLVKQASKETFSKGKPKCPN